MANFQQHLNTAVIASGALVVPLNSAGILSTSESLAALSLGLLGGVLPDIDSDTSKPVEVAFKILSIFIPLLVLVSINTKDFPIFYIIGIWLASSLILHLTLFKVFLSLTTHRGVFHSIPMGFLLYQITAIVFLNVLGYESVFANVAGFFVFFGYMIHLLLDEFVSLNVLGIKTKSSFGSAFKLYDKKNIPATVVLYVMIIALYIYSPIDLNVFKTIANLIVNIKII